MADETPITITPEFIADPDNRDALRDRARNTANVNPAPTTKVPVKSQAIDGPTATREAKALADAEQATVDPLPAPATPPDVAQTADSQQASTAQTADADATETDTARKTTRSK